MNYDQLRASWTAPAPCLAASLGASQPTVELRLGDFRQLQVFGGLTPACYQVLFCCPACGDVHKALATQQELDWQPLMGLWPVFHNLMTGTEQWQPGHGQWLERMRNGHWPLAGWCRHRRRAAPLWPSQLKAIEPAAREDHYLVCFDCPVCEKAETETMRAERLAYGAF